MLSRLSRKIGSWLGLLAILMATLAPTVSQTLAARANDDAPAHTHRSTASMREMSSMDDDSACAAPASHPDPVHKHTQQHTQKHTQRHAQASDGDACGYCNLLAHLPALPAVEAAVVVALRAREHAGATRFESVRRIAAPGFAQPRAPPAVS